jgi:hypothetical protein
MLGAFNGIGLAAFLWWQARSSPTQRWLALLILVVGLRTGKSVAFFFWPDIPRVVLQVGLTACFLIGPCLYFLIRSSQAENGGSGRADRWHLAGVLTLATGVNVLLPYVGHPELWRNVITPGITYSWLAYLLIATALVYRLARRPERPGWPLLPGVLAGIWFIWIAYYTSGYTCLG